MVKVLVVDDNAAICLTAAAVLESRGYEIQTAANGEEASRLLATTAFDVLVTDIGLPRISGLDLLREIQRSAPDASVVLMTGDPTIATATTALQGGAFDYLVKPINTDGLLNAVSRAAALSQLKAQKRRLEQENRDYQQRLERMVEDRTAALRRSEARFKDILAVAPVGIYVSHRGYLREVNPAFCAMLGFPPEELLDHHDRLLYRTDEACAAVRAELDRAMGAAGTARFETAMRRRDDSTCHVLLHAAPMAGPAAGDGPLTVVVLDMTDQLRVQAERERSEAALRQAQKMDAVGRLAAGIAHEINTPSHFVTDNLAFLSTGLGDLCRQLAADAALRAAEGVRGLPLAQAAQGIAADIDAPYLLEEIPKILLQSTEGMERIRTIVLALRDFSHPAIDTKSPTDVNHLLRNALTITKNEWKYVAVERLDLDPDLPTVNCMAGEISQVLLNLIVNASHAMAENLVQDSHRLGTLAISSARQGAWVEIRITDSGRGIAKDIRHRIFEPFFTTKGIGQGTGQGLALAWSVVVDKHFGSLTFTSEPGRGTTFVVRLPVLGERLAP